MTLTSDERAMLRGICADPADDARRLGFADMLEENAGMVACEACKGTGWRMNANPVGGGFRPYPDFPAFATIGCPQCDGKRDYKGSGVVPDGREAWAEFIRVQCELEHHPHVKNIRENDYDARDGISDEWQRGFDLQRRERELFDARRATWFPDAANTEHVAGRFDGNGWTNYVVMSWLRGFPAVVRGTLVSLRGTVCNGCSGGVTGWHGEYPCEDCAGVGRVGGVLMALVGWPIERVEVTDITIFDSLGNETCYVGNLGIFDKKYWRELENHHTRTSALKSLSRVMIAESRDDAAKLASVMT